MKTEAITLIKEDILALGQMVNRTVQEMTRLLEKKPEGSLLIVEERETRINKAAEQIEEKCLDLLLERENLSPQEIRTLIGGTAIATKLERMGDHANRIARVATWAAEDKIPIPDELVEMAGVVQRMVEDALLVFLTDDADKVHDILQRDNSVDYLHDVLSKRLLSDLGEQSREQAQMRMQFLFCARFMERMGDACTSIAKKVYFIVTGQRLRSS